MVSLSSPNPSTLCTPTIFLFPNSTRNLCPRWKSPPTFFVDCAFFARSTALPMSALPPVWPHGAWSFRFPPSGERPRGFLRAHCKNFCAVGTGRPPQKGPPDANPPLLRLPRHLADAEDHELGRLHRGDADLANHLAGVDDFRRVGLGVALHVERLLRRLAHQRARVVDAQEERRDVAVHPLPEPFVVRLEHHPLRPDLDRLLDHQEQAPHVDVP